MQPVATDFAPQGTRLALIEAGFHLFGRHSFAASSTRQLATRAKTNIGSIAYHFGGKEGLRQACAEEIVRRISTMLDSSPPGPDVSPQAARVQLQTTLRGMVAFLVGGHQADNVVPFILRELQEGGPALDIFYQRLVEPTHRRLCLLWGAATGQDPESEAVRLAVFSTIGQVLYFRIGSRIVTRRMDWADIGSAQAERITETLLANLDAQLGTLERS